MSKNKLLYDIINLYLLCRISNINIEKLEDNIKKLEDKLEKSKNRQVIVQSNNINIFDYYYEILLILFAFILYYFFF